MLSRSLSGRFVLAVAAFALAWSPATLADALADLFTEGSANLDFRYRLELVDDDLFPRDATASTLRTRLTFKSGEVSDFSALLQFDDLRAIGDDSYNSTRNGNITRAVVADPEGTDFNQVFLKYAGLSDTNLIFGRQRIKLDNDRFIGNVGWRQNEQTYDAFAIINKSMSDLQATYAYVDNVNRVFGPESGFPAADFRSDSHVLNLKFSGWNLGTLSAYGYFLDLDNAAALSSATYGARFTGQAALGEEISLLYTGEYAHQEDNGNNPNDYSAGYTMLEGGVKYGALTGKVSYEVLEGSTAGPGMSFQTPLATLHAFQGWADRFLVTPAEGVEDLYFTLGVDGFGAKFLFVYHDFESEATSQSWGSEYDLLVSKKFAKRYSAMLKYANYSADNHLTDVERFWLMFSAGF